MLLFSEKNIQVEFICSNQFKLLTKYFRNAISLTWLKVHAYVTIDVYSNHLKFKSLFFLATKKNSFTWNILMTNSLHSINIHIKWYNKCYKSFAFFNMMLLLIQILNMYADCFYRIYNKYTCNVLTRYRYNWEETNW